MSVRDVMRTDFIVVPDTTTGAEALRRAETQQANYVVVELSDGGYSVWPVREAHGQNLRFNLQLAVGREHPDHDVPLAQVRAADERFLPRREPVAPDAPESAADEVCRVDGQCTVVVDGGAVVGVYHRQPLLKTHYLLLSSQITVEEAVSQVQAAPPETEFVVVAMPDRRYAVLRLAAQAEAQPESTAEGGRLGRAEYTEFRARLNRIADDLGPDILQMTLEEVPGFLTPCTPVGLDDSRQTAGNKTRRGPAVVLQEGELVGVYDGGPQRAITGGLPTNLFGPRRPFGRTEPSQGRTCRKCGATFAYFQPVREGTKITGYVCPHCGAPKREAVGR